ncbi:MULTISPECIES: protoporphyrinogen oxidase [Brevibacterium]|uniref:Coproporphyrinogen III oxidase n=1 Tax=Brevibacterium antiquum CNRZ 918 TaxID=1255637 RepID=A0A2H1HLG8_9MICO|nr:MULTISPECIES: protoporphyrinogen oxidase [Brevibacterium]SMX63762.1 oxygen-dependent protoporphyrinogen oxidase [Brevibacterium antiquum CNRZ 918]HCG57550.1 protoporphyrinogen oxidase [Brevibacterium sp.]
MSHITIVGGGISGLVTAYRLAAEHQVTLFEAEARLGGCLHSTTLDGTVPVGFDTGAEASLYRRRETKELAAELGLDVEFPSTAHSSRVLSNGRLHAIPKRTVMGVPGNSTEVRDLLGAATSDRVAHEVITGPIDGRDVSLGDFLTDRLGADLVDTLIDPLLGGVYAGRCRDLSLASTVPALLPAALEGTSVLELVASLLAARDAQTAALAKGESPQPAFMSLIGGINRLVPALEERIRAHGGTIHTGTHVTSVQTEGGRWMVTTEDDDLESDAVVLATPAHVTKDLLAEAAPHSASLLASVPYASTALIPALVEVGDRELEGSGFLVPPTEKSFIKASTFVSNKWPWMGERIPEGAALIRMSIGRYGDGPGGWRDCEDEELIARAYEDWQSIADRGSDRLIAAEAHRWERALPQYLPGHGEMVERIDADIADITGLELAGSAYIGLGIPACIDRAKTVAQRIASTQT